jgi:transposase-like protein
MMERGLQVDHSSIGRWVLRHAPELNKPVRRELRPPNRSWRVDEIRVAGVWTYLYRAVDSAGETIDFMLSPKSVMSLPPSTSYRWRCGGPARSGLV